MAGGACKAALCAGLCLSSIVVDEAREATEATRELAANDQLTEEQENQIIRLYTAFEKEVKRRKDADLDLLDKVKKIVLEE